MVKNILILKFRRSRHKLYFTHTQTRIKAYTLILEKNFRICEREKKVFVIQKLYDSVIQTALGSPKRITERRHQR